MNIVINKPITTPGIPNNPVSKTVHHSIVTIIPKKANIPKTMPPTTELITNLITTLSGNVRIFSTIIKSTYPIKKDPIVIIFHRSFL